MLRSNFPFKFHIYKKNRTAKFSIKFRVICTEMGRHRFITVYNFRSTLLIKTLYGFHLGKSTSGYCLFR